MRKPVFEVSEQVRHKPSCAATEDVPRGLKPWIKIEEGLRYPCNRSKGADQLRSYSAADLRLCFRICKGLFSHDAAHLSVLLSNFHRFMTYFALMLSRVYKLISNCDILR